MKQSDVVPLFEALLAVQVPKVPTGTVRYVDNSPIYSYDEPSAHRWITRAEAALDSVFPAAHAVKQRWNRIINRDGADVSEEHVLDGARGVFVAALDILKAGGLSTLVDGIRADTAAELLDQADTLVGKGYLAAAAVLAGGALETHLYHLCLKHAVTWNGVGSISAYDGAIATARNQGHQLYSLGDSKLIVAWGGMRNDAAHAPTTFQRNAKEVGIMITGIREFIIRVP